MFAALALLSSAAGFSLKKAGGLDKTFDGLGGLSGGGATTRLLVDYPEDQKEEILDVLFKPNYGASPRSSKWRSAVTARARTGRSRRTCTTTRRLISTQATSGGS